MKKRLAVIFLFVVALGLIMVGLGIDPALRSGVEVGGTSALKTDTLLEEADLSVFGGRLALTDLEILNPDGFKTERAVRVGSIDLQASVMSLLGDTVEVEHVIIESPEITLEVGPNGSNLGALIANAEGAAPTKGGATTGADEPAPDEPARGPSKKLHIGLVRITQPKVIVSQTLVGETTTTLTLGDIELNDLGTGSDSTTDIGGLFQKVLAAILSATADHSDISGQIAGLLKGEIDLPSLEGLVNDLEGTKKGLQDAATNLEAEVKKTEESLIEAGKNLEDAAKDLFKKR